MYSVAIQYDDTLDIVPTPEGVGTYFEDVNEAVKYRNQVAETYRQFEPGHGAISVLVMYGAREWV